MPKYSDLRTYTIKQVIKSMNQQEQTKKLYYMAPLATLFNLRLGGSVLEHFSFEGNLNEDFEYGGSLDDDL